MRRPTASTSAGEPGLYFHAYDHHSFTHQDWPFDYEIVVNHSFTSPVLSRIAGRGLWGTQLLTLLTAYEDRFPRLAGRVGRYPADHHPRVNVRLPCPS